VEVEENNMDLSDEMVNSLMGALEREIHMALVGKDKG
jgi:hypothetical protein